MADLYPMFKRKIEKFADKIKKESVGDLVERKKKLQIKKKKKKTILKEPVLGGRDFVVELKK